MSENITIKEGGIAQGFGGVTVLRTNNGDGYDQWVPKKDVNTKSVTFKKNGKYATRAYLPDKGEKITVDSDVYGYSSVTVSVVNKTSGKKKKYDPTTGEEYDAPYSVDVDDEGNITEKELPTKIKITKNPQKMKYKDGDEIDIKGIVVHGYLADGSDWGQVPFGELEFEPEKATIVEEEWGDGDGINAIKVLFTQTTIEAPDGVKTTKTVWNHKSVGTTYNDAAGEKEAYYYLYLKDVAEPHYIFLTKYNGVVYCATEDQSVGFLGSLTTLWNVSYNEYYWYGSSGTMTVNDRFQSCAEDMPYKPNKSSVIWDGIPESTKNPSGVNLNRLHPTKSANDVTVSWDRGDGEELTDKYEIEVTPKNTDNGTGVGGGGGGAW